jgi:hypothetical protein
MALLDPLEGLLNDLHVKILHGGSQTDTLTEDQRLLGGRKIDLSMGVRIWR